MKKPTHILCLSLSACLMLWLPQAACGYAAPENWELRVHPNGEVYHLYVPEGLEAGRLYPAVLALHGCCWNSVMPTEPPRDPVRSAFHGFSRNLQVEPTFIIAPYSANAWINKVDRIMAVLDEVRLEFPLDPQRLILTGFSMGGAGGIQYLDRHPDTFAGAILVAVALNNLSAFTPSNLKGIPIWGAVGTADTWMGAMNNVFARIRAANGFEELPAPELFGPLPRYQHFPRVGHGEAMEGLLGDPEVIAWAYQLRRDGNAMPMVRFIAPTPEPDTLLPPEATSLTLAAEAFDEEGPVRSVEFFHQGQSLGVHTSPPFSVTVGNLVPGANHFRVVVTDRGRDLGFSIDKVNEDRRSVHLPRPMAFVTESLPPARVGEFYDTQVEVTGIDGPPRWNRANLPAGLTLGQDGRIRGIPSEVETRTFLLTVNDAEDRLSRSFTLQVLPPRPNQVVLRNLNIQGNAVAQPWRFAEGEPWRTTGYGSPPGAFDPTPHPYFDTIHATDGIAATVLLRLSSSDANSTRADWLSFSTDLPVRLHLAYAINQEGRFPGWLSQQGFTATGKVIETYLVNFAHFVKDFPAGTIQLPGNDGESTGSGTQYLVLIEGLSDSPANYPWPVDAWSGRTEDPLLTWMGALFVDRSYYPWIAHPTYGWLYLFGDSPDSLWMYHPESADFWWTAEPLFPWIYRWEDGWGWYPPLF